MLTSTDSPPGIRSKASPFSFDDTLQHILNMIHNRGLTLFADIDHSQEAARVGDQLHPARLLLFGRPKAGTPLITASPLIGLELPLRVLIWQEGQGQVWVSYTSPDYLAQRYGLPNDLIKNIAGLDALIDGVLKG